MSVIQVDHVSRAFVIPHTDKATRRGRIETFMRGRAHSEDEKFYAVRDVSFSVERGETVGLVGRNGSGKSTLLKILANILRPTSGNLRVEGKVSPLLELGMSLHKELTAVENIFLYGGYLGMSRSWTEQRVERILDFAELERFRDAKLKSFSSGMKARLAFSVAIQVEPDILMLDEVFAVGDFMFKQKCLKEMGRFKEAGTTILFVSHDFGAVRRFCDRTLVMESGELIFDGDTEQALELYIYRAGEQRKQQVAAKGTKEPCAEDKSAPKPIDITVPKRWGNGPLRIERVCFLDKNGNEREAFRSGDPLRIRLHYSTEQPVADPVFGISLHNLKRVRVYGTNTRNLDKRIDSIAGTGAVDFIIPSFAMAAGEYLLTVAAHDYNDDSLVYDRIEREYSFNVANPYPFAGEVDLRAEFEVVQNV
ncbi:MAG: ABC transporter ATP-binding protein [Candidatus Alcyoniella australis]|nr:ABC transporter ATP-binding protein [Candidatus Alcyoniella australis]